jgi:hypothetical protein
MGCIISSSGYHALDMLTRICTFGRCDHWSTSRKFPIGSIGRAHFCSSDYLNNNKSQAVFLKFITISILVPSLLSSLGLITLNVQITNRPAQTNLFSPSNGSESSALPKPYERRIPIVVEDY